jgi:cytochrome P450
MTDHPVLLPYRREMPRPFDPAEELGRLRAEEPVCRQQAPNGAWVWLVTRYPDVCQVLSDRSFSNTRTPQTLLRPRATGVAAVGAPARQPGSFLGYDPPDHTRLRRMVSTVFTARRTAMLRPRIEEIVGQLLDLMEQAGPPADLHHAFSLQLPSRLICDLLGVPYEGTRAWPAPRRPVPGGRRLVQPSVGRPGRAPCEQIPVSVRAPTAGSRSS